MSNFSFVPRATALAAATFMLSLSTSNPAFALGSPVYSPAPPAAPGCVGGTLTDYQQLTTAGCTVGALTYYNFTPLTEYVDGSPTNVNQADSIIVTPGLDPANPSLRFSSSLFDRTLITPATSADYYFEYYMDPPIDILGFQLDDLPFSGNSYVEASVCVGGTFGPGGGLTGGEGVPSYGGGEGAPDFNGGYGYGSPQYDCVPNNDEISRTYGRDDGGTLAVTPPAPQYYYFEIDANTPLGSDGTTFANPDLFVDVFLHVHIGPGGSVPDFGTTSPVRAIDASSVPEPAEWTLTALGGLVMIGTLRRKRRRAPTVSA